MKLHDIIDEPVESLEQLVKLFKGLQRNLVTITESVHLLKEYNIGLDWHAGQMSELDHMLYSTQQRFEATRRGLSLANKLPAGPDRTKHLRRIMGHMNRIRAAVTRLERLIAAEAKAVS